MIDIDNFKEINDRYGHPAGDSVLAEIARAVRSVIRDSDYLIRMGGDEMMICFSGMKPRHLGSKLEDIRKAAADIRFAGHEGLRPTVSVGAAVCREYSEEARERADRALYEAKRTKNYAVIREDG